MKELLVYPMISFSPSLLRYGNNNINHCWNISKISHLHCCIPKLLSHNPRGLRKLFWRLSRTPKSTSLPFFEILFDLLYSLNLEGTWLQAMGMDYLLTDVKIFTLLAGWFQQRTDIKEWLLALAATPLPKRKYRISITIGICSRLRNQLS